MNGWQPTAPWARPIYEVYAERMGGMPEGWQPKKTENPAPTERPPTDQTDPAAPGTVFAEIEDPARTMPPVKTELIRVMSDSEIQRMLNAAISRVRAGVADALVAEQEMIGLGRNNLKGILVLSDKLLVGLQRLTDTVVERLNIMASDTGTDPKGVLDMIDRVIKINGSTIQAGAKLLEMQRLMVGMPTSIHEQRNTGTAPAEDAPTDDAREELLKRLARARRKAETSSEEDPAAESSLPEHVDGSGLDDSSAS